MCKLHKAFSLITIVIIALIIIPAVYASHFLSFSSPAINVCNLIGINISGTINITAGGDADLRYTETVNGVPTGSDDLLDTGTFANYLFDTFTLSSFPYSFSAILFVRSRSTGAILEQYELYGTCIEANIGTVAFRELPIPTSVLQTEGDNPRQIFTDGRINSFDTGSPVVLFGKPDSDGNWHLEIYSADGSGLLLVIAAEAIDAVAACPESNTLIHNDAATGISLWRLPERTITAEGVRVCPFQLNAPSTEAGKTYIIIFDTLYPNTYYESRDEWVGN